MVRIILLTAAVEKKQMVEALQLGSAAGVVVEGFRHPTVAQEHSCGDGRGSTGWDEKASRICAVPAEPHAEYERGIETDEEISG